jgi:prepilin-type N-terminal cleavage/methylation domain-containing protein
MSRCCVNGPSTSRAAGYTLIELVVALLVCSILLAAAIPKYTDALLQYRVDAAAKRIAADIDFMQRQAIAKSASQSMIFTPSGGSPGTPNTYSMPTIQYVDRAATGAVVDLAQHPYQATLLSANFGGTTTLTFDRYGALTSGGTIVIGVGAAQKTITVNGDTGRVANP